MHVSLWLARVLRPRMRPSPDVSRRPSTSDGLTAVSAHEADDYYLPWPRCSWLASLASPTGSSGSVRTFPRRTPPRRAAAVILPPSASLRARVPCVGDTCVGSTTPGTVRLRPNTQGRRWTPARTSRPPDAVCPSGRSSIPAAHNVGRGSGGERYQSVNNGPADWPTTDRFLVRRARWRRFF